jgi:hypothetical protein
MARREDRAAGDVAEPGVFVEGEVDQVSGTGREHKFENKVFRKVCHRLDDELWRATGWGF